MIWDKIYFGNSVLKWIIALGAGLGAFIALALVNSLLKRHLKKTAAKTKNIADDAVLQVLSRTKYVLILIISVYIGSRAVFLPGRIAIWLGVITKIAIILQIGFWINTLITFWLRNYQKKNMETNAAAVTTMRGASFILRLILFSLVILLSLDNIPGVEITALIASLGIGSVAIALAVQSTLADLFASLSISLDQPFVIGDFIIVGDLMGVVENIGLKTTRIRSLSGEQLVFSNNDLLSSRIRNFKRMKERRVAFNIGVTYQTSSEQIKQIPGIIQTAIKSQPNTRFDRSHFFKYGDFSLIFESVYYIGTADYNEYMDIQQAINIQIYDEFDKQDIEFAYPTQTLFVNKSE